MSKKHLHENTEEYNEEFCEENYTERENTEKTALNPEDCKALVCPDCTIFKEAEDTRIRALAEMENFKKRLQKEKEKHPGLEIIYGEHLGLEGERLAFSLEEIKTIPETYLSMIMVKK